jgi:hypothetical protein
MNITFDATNGFGKTFDLGFVSMQNTGTVGVPEGGSTLGYLGLSLSAFVVGMAAKRKWTAFESVQ